MRKKKHTTHREQNEGKAINIHWQHSNKDNNNEKIALTRILEGKRKTVVRPRDTCQRREHQKIYKK